MVNEDIYCIAKGLRLGVIILIFLSISERYILDLNGSWSFFFKNIYAKTKIRIIDL